MALSVTVCTFIVLGSLASAYGVIETTLEPLPQELNYKAAGTKYDDGGMGPMYNFARSFINSSLPGGFPMEFINGRECISYSTFSNLYMSKALQLNINN